MKKYLILFLILFFSSCALFRTPEEKAAIEREERKIDSCAKAMKILEEDKITKPYEILTVISSTERNGNDEYMFYYLRRMACERGADAIIYPKMESGIRNTTYTSKIIVWKK